MHRPSAAWPGSSTPCAPAARTSNLHRSSERLFSHLGAPGRAFYRGTRGAVHGFLARFTNNEALYSNLDIKYIGPVHGHDLPALEETLKQAKDLGRPVIVHVITEKGHGFEPAVADVADQFHAVGQIDPETGEPIEQASRPSWTSVFADEIVELADRNPRLVGITAAMLRPTGLHRFAEKHPDRVFDVGIAEQHAVTSAAGLAFGGLHPVVAIYATFVNRAFDQVLMDVALHRAGVTFVLDRAGVTGPDGPSHHGMWDLAILQVVPGIRLAAPRDATRLREELAEAVAVEDGPTVLRFSKGNVGNEFEAERRTDDGVDVLREAAHRDVLIVTVGPMAKLGLQVAERLAAQGIGATVVDPRWVVPVPGRASSRWRATTGSSSRSRTASGSAASARGSARICARPGRHGRRRARAAGPVPRARLPRRDPRRGRAHRSADRPRHRLAGARHRGHPHPGRAAAAGGRSRCERDDQAREPTG